MQRFLTPAILSIGLLISGCNQTNLTSNEQSTAIATIASLAKPFAKTCLAAIASQQDKTSVLVAAGFEEQSTSNKNYKYFKYTTELKKTTLTGVRNGIIAATIPARPLYNSKMLCNTSGHFLNVNWGDDFYSRFIDAAKKMGYSEETRGFRRILVKDGKEIFYRYGDRDGSWSIYVWGYSNN